MRQHTWQAGKVNEVAVTTQKRLQSTNETERSKSAGMENARTSIRPRASQRSRQNSASWNPSSGTRWLSFFPDGVVGGADTIALREMCRWYRQYNEAMDCWRKQPLDKDARLSATAAWDRFWAIAKDFGCTPVSRARLQIHDDDDKADDPLAGLRLLVASRN